MAELSLNDGSTNDPGTVDSTSTTSGSDSSTTDSSGTTSVSPDSSVNDPAATTDVTSGGGVTEPSTVDGYTEDGTFEPEDVESYEAEAYGPPTTVDKDFTYATHIDPMRKLPAGGPYLDDVMRQQAEVQRAKIEGREPDLLNPPAMQSTPLIPTQIAQGLAHPFGNHNVQPDVTLPVVVGVSEDDLEFNAEAKRYRDNQAANGTTTTQEPAV